MSEVNRDYESKKVRGGAEAGRGGGGREGRGEVECADMWKGETCS